MEIPPCEWHIIWHKTWVLAEEITSMRGCVARNNLWPWPISSRSFSCDVAFLMDYIHLWHRYNPWGDDHFPVNRLNDNVSRAIRIFVVGTRAIQTLVDQDLQLLVMMTSSNGNIFRVTGPLCEEFTGEVTPQRPVTRSFDVFFDLRLNTRLSKQLRRRWFKTPSRSLWRHCNVNSTPCSQALAIKLKRRRIPVGNALFSV